MMMNVFRNSDSATVDCDVPCSPKRCEDSVFDPATATAELLEDGAPEWLADAMVGLQAAFGKGIADLNNDHVFRVTGNHPQSFATFASDHAKRFVSEDGV